MKKLQRRSSWQRLLLLLLLILSGSTCHDVVSDDEPPPAQAAEISLTGETTTTLQAAASAEQQKQQQQRLEKRAHELEQQAFAAMNSKNDKNKSNNEAQELWRQVLALNPRSGNAHTQLGLAGLFSSDYAQQAAGVELLEKAFDEHQVDKTIPWQSQQGIFISGLMGRWRWERAEYESAQAALRRAWLATGKRDVCLATQLATLLHPYPTSLKHADLMMESYIKRSKALLAKFKQRPDWRIDNFKLVQQAGAAAEDPYVHCVLTIFHLSFYYRADVALASKLHYEITAALWPQLLYVAPRVKEWQRNYPKPQLAADAATTTNNNNNNNAPKPCATNNKIRLGIASGALSQHHSVSSDFKGVLMRLNRRKFRVTYIYLEEQAAGAPVDSFVYRHAQDEVIVLRRNKEQDLGQTDVWLGRFRDTIEALQLDVLLYLDLTMSSYARRVGMAKLAPVQATTHGHPVTSGISSKTVDYYISWQAAELANVTAAQTHYTEQLILLPGNVPHQYYTKRSNGTHSMINGMEYQSWVDRRTFFHDLLPPDQSPPPADKHWYVCMQKPHKFQPEVDPLFCNVLTQDVDAILVLHREERSDFNQERIVQRLQVAGCDLQRVYFIGGLEHHRLLALYQQADVILDSYPAGGCTTTREVLELGKVVVTLPARLLGGRWSYAYYKILKDKTLIDLVVAESEQDYVRKAVALGRNTTLRRQAERRVQKSLHRLYQQQSSVESWETVLRQIAPISLDPQTCVSTTTTTKR